MVVSNTYSVVLLVLFVVVCVLCMVVSNTYSVVLFVLFVIFCVLCMVVSNTYSVVLFFLLVIVCVLCMVVLFVLLVVVLCLGYGCVGQALKTLKPLQAHLGYETTKDNTTPSSIQLPQDDFFSSTLFRAEGDASSLF